MKVYLIGMPGCGKTTLGRMLAQHFHYIFVDLDEKIEKKTGKSISEIFQQQGKKEFRKIEHDYLKKLSESQGNFIIATGGGTPCYYDNLELIKQNGKSIFINTPLHYLTERLWEDQKRPLFNNWNKKDYQDQLEKLLNERLPFYQKAHVTVSGSLPKDQLLKVLILLID